MTLLVELKYIMTSARNTAAFAKGMVELRSIAFYSREERERWWQGPRCLRCSKLRRIGGLGGLMITPRRSSGCGACIPELTIRNRHRGRSQAPWTIVMLVRKPSQSIHTSRETYYTFRRRSRMPCVFSWPPLLVGDAVEVVSPSATSSSREFALTSLYSIYIRSCSQQTVCSTPTHTTSTKLNCYSTTSCTAVCTCLNIVALI